jgi:hypothetical protein
MAILACASDYSSGKDPLSRIAHSNLFEWIA